MARLIPRGFQLLSRSTFPPLVAFSFSQYHPSGCLSSAPFSIFTYHPTGRRRFHVLTLNATNGNGPEKGFSVPQRGYRKMSLGNKNKKLKPKPKPKQLEFCVEIGIEEDLPQDPQILNIAEMLRLNIPMAMKIAFDGLGDTGYKTRDTSIDNVGKFEKADLSLLLCNDKFIQKLNKEWRDEDSATDVLSMSQHIPELNLPFLVLGDIAISIDTAARQAEERGHTLLDEIRILVVHGLLHLLGFDHELSEDAEKEMEKEEELILKSLGWKGKGLIKSANDYVTDELQMESSNDVSLNDKKKEDVIRIYKPKFKYIFCDMDGTLLNSKNLISSRTAEALREAVAKGVKIVIATGKTRSAAISVLELANLTGKDGVVSENSVGVFLQGLLVYGMQGREIFRRNLDKAICQEAFLYSLEHEVPLVAFSKDRILTLFNHPLVDKLHTTFYEPKAEVMSSVDQLIEAADINKMLFYGTTEGISTNLRPYWLEASKGRADITQAQTDMLEIIPPDASKGKGVKLLLDHLGVTPKEIMAIGDGENDIEMLELAGLGVALSNGSEKTKFVADVIEISNDEDGAAEAIYKYAL
ncbi:Hydrolase Cof, related [Zostera marina]|uniref:Hydrolase Cof, related n=1 Tax=Zostera marina TaxID=29655 RepID=A0A0K9Q3F0_ZOSMR|nr:Hydrolase Cof, related [Zostera marina]